MNIETLRARTTTEPYATLWKYLVSRWEGVAACEAETDGYMKYGGLAWHSFTPMLPEAALIHHLTDREDALAYAKKCIGYFLDEYDGIDSIDDYKRNRPWVWTHLNVALAADICRNVLPKNTRKGIAGIMRKCIDFNHMDSSLFGYSAGSNVILAQNVTAAICALTWGEESGHPYWEEIVELAAEAVHQYVRHGSDSDGFWYEGSCYGIDVYSTLIFFYAQLLLQNNRRDLFEEIPTLEKVADAAQHMMMPDYEFMATTGDGGTGAPYGCWWLHLTARYYNRPDHLGFWHAFQGPNHPIRPWGDIWPWKARFKGADEHTAISSIGHPDNSLLMTFLHYDADAPVQSIEASPVPTAIFGTGTGTATFRTSWNKNATFAILLGSGRNRATHGHAHADCGHFGISVGGEYLAIDTGRYNTNEDQHNVVLIDGKNRLPSSSEGGGMSADTRSGRFKRYERHRLLDRCCADASHMKNVIWALRDFFFVRLGGDEAYIITLDNINDNAQHTYQWQLNAHPDAKIEITGDTTATIRGTAARLDCAFFQKPKGPLPDKPHSLTVRTDIAEWVWPYGRDVDMSPYEGWGTHLTVLERPLLIAEQETWSCMLASVIMPRRDGQTSFSSITSFPVANGIGLEVKSEEYIDRFFAAPDHAYIVSEYANGSAEFAMERRTHTGEVVDCWVEKGGDVTFDKPSEALDNLVARTQV